MITDYFTKPLQGSPFRKFCDQIMNINRDPDRASCQDHRSVLDKRSKPKPSLSGLKSETEEHVRGRTHVQERTRLPGRTSLRSSKRTCLRTPAGPTEDPTGHVTFQGPKHARGPKHAPSTTSSRIVRKIIHDEMRGVANATLAY
jgi:hypothetical protein